MAASEEEVVIDLSKMKVPELKKELQLRGLKVTGNKQDLIDRLQNYLEEHEGAEVADDEFLKDDGDSILSDDKKLEETEPEPVKTDPVEIKKDIKESQPEQTVTDEPKEINNKEEPSVVPIETKEVSDADKKAARAKKFGLAVTDLPLQDRKQARSERFSTGGSEDDKLKRRAERFGASNASSSVNDEKKKARLEKFGAVDATAPMDEKKKKRAERFGISVA